MRNGCHPPFFHSACRRAVIAIALGLAAPGCQKPIQPDQPTASALEQSDDIDALWNASLNVLRKVEFRPDRQDRSLGIITTLPTTSAQWFEPWRQDVATPYDLLESSIATVQRKATVRFIKSGGWSIEVQVDVYRLSETETQVTSASSVLHGFSGNLPTESGFRPQDGQAPPSHWVHIGRDAALEERLLTRILNSADDFEVATEETTEITPS